MTQNIIVPKWATETGQDQYGFWAIFCCGNTQQKMRWIEPGKFMMGFPDNEPRHWWGEENQREVIISKGFWLADTACTQELWQKLILPNPSYFKGPLLPVDGVSWYDANYFINYINQLIPSLNACLPTEAQWEYACRAGTTTPFSFGKTVSFDQVNCDDEEVHHGNRRFKTVEVFALPCNSWGLYQMHGNVWEWCQDFYGPYSKAAVVDPICTEQASFASRRARRGGSWYNGSCNCRSASRNGSRADRRHETFGFRIAAKA